MRSLLILVALCNVVSISNAQKIGKFGSSVEKRLGPKKIRVPYTDVISYLGYAEPGSEDAIVGGKKFTYLYVWVPAVAPELGLRMVSPANGDKVKDPIMAPNYEANKETKEFFDTYITLERSDITSLDGVTAEAIAAANWIILDYNDDTSELKAQPDGRKYNSLLRYKSDAGDPLRALTVGLYRIGFTTFKRGEVKGTFLAQIGAPVKLLGVIITRDINELTK
ncbi:MAG: LipL32 family surface lipoprotein [Bacteroidota bacterium]